MISARRWRSLLRANPDIPRSRIGHTEILTAEAMEMLLARLEVSEVDDGSPREVTTPRARDVQSQDEVLRALGLRAVER